jgi:hypothetical protein
VLFFNKFDEVRKMNEFHEPSNFKLEGEKIPKNITETIKDLESARDHFSNEETVAEQPDKAEEPKTTCLIQIAKINGLPVLDVQGNIIDALGLLDYAYLYVEEEAKKYIEILRKQGEATK